MKNKTINIITLIVSTGIMLYFFIFSHGLEALVQHSRNLNKYWILLAVFSMLLFWLFETITLHFITKALYKGNHFFIRSLKFTMIGQLYGSLTPFSSGSQPAQIFAMTETGIPAGSAGSILMIKFIIHEVVYLVYLIIALITKFNYFNAKINYFIYFCFFGFFLNVTIILFALLFSLNSNIPKKILQFIFKFLSKVRFVKNPQEKCKKIQMELTSFHDNIAFISKNKKLCFFALIFTLLQLTSYYIIPYYIYRAFGFASIDVFTMITAQVFLTMFMSCIPLPGSEGGAEAGFYIIFGIFFKHNTIMPAIFIWRIIIYYLAIAVGSVFTVILPSKNIKIENINE